MNHMQNLNHNLIINYLIILYIHNIVSVQFNKGKAWMIFATLNKLDQHDEYKLEWMKKQSECQHFIYTAYLYNLDI